MAQSRPNEEKNLRLLVVEDSQDDALLLAGCFRRAGYNLEFRRVDNADDMREALLAQRWDALLSDHSMPGFSALAALKLMQQLQLDLTFIIVSGVIEEETAIAAMRAGAHDYLSKDRLDRLVPAVEREIREAKNRAEKRAALEALRESESRFRTLVANIPGVVFQLQQSSDGVMQFQYVNENASWLFGIPPDELRQNARLFIDALDREDRSSLDTAFELSARKGTQVCWDGRIMLADGTQKWINLRAAPRRIASGAMLWEGIVSDITQSKQTEVELRTSRSQLAELSSHLESVREDERERIARDIHDELGGMLVAIKIEASLLSSKLPQDPLQLRRRVRGIESLVDEAINTVSRIARELRPGILKDFGLAAAIECQADDFSQRVGLSTDTSGVRHDIDPDEKTALALFRAYQEALTNIAKHAQATWVGIRFYQEGDELILEIADNGRGISADDASKPKSYGLRSIRERMHGLGGTLEVAANVPQGTRILLRLPRRHAAPSPE